MRKKPESKVYANVEYKHSVYIDCVKRILDIFVAVVGGIVAIPLLLVISIITFFDVGFPIIFKQERVGKGGKSFTMYKFRNMTNECDENGELLPPQDRVTKIGKVIRATSLDELPQIWNILKGDMSVIGPRPYPPEYVSCYTKEQLRRLSVKPGLECPAYKKENTPKTWDDQFNNDVWYVDHCSFLVDFHQCFRLVHMVFDFKNSTKNRRIDGGREDPIPLSERQEVAEKLIEINN